MDAVWEDGVGPAWYKNGRDGAADTSCTYSAQDGTGDDEMGYVACIFADMRRWHGRNMNVARNLRA